MPAPGNRDRRLTGACLALGGVVVGVAIAWALLRPGPAPARAPVVLVPSASAPVAQVDPRTVAVYPSSAFTPDGGDQRAVETMPTRVNPMLAQAEEPAVEDQRHPAGHLPPERIPPLPRSEVFVHPGTNPVFLASGPVPPLSGDGQSSAIEDALSYALEGMDPYLKRGYVLREDTWGGELPVGEGKAIPHQLFEGNDYRFCVGTSGQGVRASVHIYDQDGALVERGLWQRFVPKGKGGFTGAVISPAQTGTYFIVVTVESSPGERTAWGMVYAYK